MPKKIIKRYIPNPEKVRQMKGLGWMKKWLKEPNLWHLNRRSVAKAFLIGLFWMAIPVPLQMVFSAIFAILFRANIALSVALVWISNPITMPPIFYFNYEIGALILGENIDNSLQFELSWHWLTTTLGDLWQPLFLGSIVVGTILGLIAFFTIHLLWRLQVSSNWKKRNLKTK
jgi:uncharacterized protein (DUF2062 family)